MYERQANPLQIVSNATICHRTVSLLYVVNNCLTALMAALYYNSTGGEGALFMKWPSFKLNLPPHPVKWLFVVTVVRQSDDRRVDRVRKEEGYAFKVAWVSLTFVNKLYL